MQSLLPTPILPTLWQIQQLQASHNEMAQEIMTYIESEPILKEAAHAKKLEENPEWALILGIGYDDSQKRSLIYKHLTKMTVELHRVTGGDAYKAKQLTDLMYMKVHAGEQRRLYSAEKEARHEHAMNAGIALSIGQFVQALHGAGGNGRYPDKIRQAQQVRQAQPRPARPLN